MKLLLLTDQQFHHTLAGLRALQYDFEQGDERWADIATDENQVARFTSEELDELCDAINCNEPSSGAVFTYLCDAQKAAEPQLNAYRDRADGMDYVREGQVEIDDNAIVSKGEDAGAYVMGWVWVDDDVAGIYTE
jgi:hypothetical protein